MQRNQWRLRLACQMGVYCPEHEFIHGAEAEELRKGIERLVAASETAEQVGEGWGGDTEVVRVDVLQKLLDTLDARDSLAFLEICKKHERDDLALARERGLVPTKSKAKKKATKRHG